MSLLIGGGQTLFGLGKTLFSKRPEKDIPPALRESLMLSKMMVSDPNAPGYTEAKASIDTATSNAIMAARQSGNAQESIGTVASGQTRGYLGLEEQNNQSQYQDLNNLQRSLDQMAQAQDTQEQYNKFAPYADQQQEGRDLFGAGLENIMGGLDAAAIAGLVGGDSLFGTKKKPTQTADYGQAENYRILQNYLKAIPKIKPF